MRAYPAATLALLGFAVLTTGCLSPKDDLSQFYVLAAPVDTARATAGDVILGLGPITLPQYLRRPQMVTRVGDNQVTISEDYRWAEDLKAGVARIMSQDLGLTTGATQILIYPWLVTRGVHYSVEVDVLRFEADSAGMVELWAAWRIREMATHSVLEADEFRIAQQAAGAARSDIVTAQGEAVVMLSRTVAAALRNIQE